MTATRTGKRTVLFVFGCVEIGLAIAAEYAAESPVTARHNESRCSSFGYESHGAIVYPSQTVGLKCWCQGDLQDTGQLACPTWTFLRGMEYAEKHNTHTDSAQTACTSSLNFTTPAKHAANRVNISVQCSVPGHKEWTRIFLFHVQEEDQDYMYVAEDDKQKGGMQDEDAPTGDTENDDGKPESGPKSNPQPFWVYILIVIAALLLIASAAGVIINRRKARRRRALRRRSARRYKSSVDEPLHRKESNGEGRPVA